MISSIRIGKVTDVNITSGTARVFFSDVGNTSGWLHVARQSSQAEQTEPETIEAPDGELTEHFHKIEPVRWLPQIGDTVLCLYDGSFNGDGFILGALQ